jgi:tyrosyl-tRNA synthetase
VVNEKEVNKVIEEFARTTEEIFTLEELRKLLISGRQLRMKFGVDVTAPDLHIGHAVNFWMYRRLQEMGHKVVFLIGDFTTQIGDPTGKNKLRPIISLEEIKKNSEIFIDQAKQILHSDKELIEIRRNSEWYGEMLAKNLLDLMSLVTQEKLMTRDMFRKRQKEGKEIYEHEIIYPILQGYDSVMLKADLTIIGSDQLYNEMMGRFYQEKFNEKPQVVITTKITPGIDGGEKQSKSLGNYIGIKHSSREKFGRVMSIADNLICEYLRVYTEVPLEEISVIEKDLKKDPMKYKLRLAREIVARYHGEKVAQEEENWFIKTFSKKEIPQDLKKVKFEKEEGTLLEVLKACFQKEKMSNSEIRRLINQKAVSVNGEKFTDEDLKIDLKKKKVILKVGKRNWFEVSC